MQTILKGKLNIGRSSWPKKHLLRIFQSLKTHRETKNASLQNNILASFMIAKKSNYDFHENTLSSCIPLTKEPLYECTQKLALYTFTFPRNQIVSSTEVDTKRDCFLLIVALYQSSFCSQLDHFFPFGTIPTYYYVRSIYIDLYIHRHVHDNLVKSNFKILMRYFINS